MPRWTDADVRRAVWDRSCAVPAAVTARTLGKTPGAVRVFWRRRGLAKAPRLVVLWLHEFCGPHDLREIARRRQTSESNVRRRKWQLKSMGYDVVPLSRGRRNG